MGELNMDFWREAFEILINQAKPSDVWRLTMDRNLHIQPPPGWKMSFQEHAYASFECSQCFHDWSSHQVMLLFHMRWESHWRQGSIKMRFFRQQCHNCGSKKYEKPQFSKESLDSILKRLVFDIRKKCYQEQVDGSQLLEVVSHTGAPHLREYCEACKLGIHKYYEGHQGASQPKKTTLREVQIPRFPQDKKPVGMEESSFTAPGSTGFTPCCCICFIIIAIIIFITCWN